MKLRPGNEPPPEPKPKVGRPGAFEKCTVDPATRSVSYHTTPPAHVEY